MTSFSVVAHNYRIVESLGEGANSCVYRAFKDSEDLGVRLDVAIKILKSEKLVSIWRNEFERLSQIKSLYCVGLLGWEITAQGPALVLEYVRGVNLRELQSSCALGAKDLEDIRGQVAQGLVDLATAGLYHGDLSPQNIMIGIDGHVKLIDFGVTAGSKNARPGDQKVQMITPKYASPEVINGQLPNLKSDLFSLDLILGEIVEKNRKEGSDAWSRGAEASLAEKVNEAFKIRGQIRAKTAQLSQERKGLSLAALCLRIASYVLIALSLLISQRDSKAAKYFSTARLIARSAKWVEIEVDGQNMGYAPLNLSLPSERKVVLKWRSSGASGQEILWPQEGGVITLDDRVFMK